MAEQWFDNKPTILETNYTACVLERTHLKGVTEVPDETMIADMESSMR